MRRFNRKWLLVIPVILVIAVVGFLVWAGSAAAAMPEALAALQSDEKVTVETDGLLQFSPTGADADTGLIFYPGAKVDPRAYAPMAHALAAEGYLVEIPSMTLNLAIFSINAADPIIAAHPEIKHWAIGGHSLGGSMAARYVQGNADKIDGILFLASYPDIDLSKLPIHATVIYGSLDGLATVTKVESTRALLPADTQWVKIEGGDHAQMGWYGPQAGDNEATISRDEQQKQVIDAAGTLLKLLA